MALLQYAYGDMVLIFCVLDFPDLSKSLFLQELHTNPNVRVCTFGSEPDFGLSSRPANFRDLTHWLARDFGPQKSLKNYFELAYPNRKRINKTVRYQKEQNWRKFYDKERLISYDPLHYAAVDAIAT